MHRKIIYVVCISMIPDSSHALGTLFYSQDERAQQLEQNGGTHIYTLDGIVRRGAGESVVWINGRAVTQTDPAFPALIISRDHVLLGGKQIRVGESLDITSGQRILHLPTVQVTR